jgi:phasin
MSDAPATMERQTKLKGSKHETMPGPGLELPNFNIPTFELPAAMRELAERSGAQAKDQYEKIRSAAAEIADVVEASFAATAKGATDCSLKVMEVGCVNTAAVLDFVGELMNATSPSEFVELSTVHARQQFDAVSRQNKELLALVQRIGAEAAEPIRAGMSKAFDRNLGSPTNSDRPRA